MSVGASGVARWGSGEPRPTISRGAATPARPAPDRRHPTSFDVAPDSRPPTPDVVRHRCFHLLDRFTLESGVELRDVRQAYYLDGALNAARDNVVVVFHALTGSADAAGDWWRDVVGPGLAIDTDRHAVLCANLLGSCYGTTATPPDDAPFPLVTTRDMAALVRRLLDALRIPAAALVVGGSLGGMVALEFVAANPAFARNAVIFAAPAAHTASAIAWNHVQRRAIELAGIDGLELARMAAMITYRTPTEFDRRFGRAAHPEGGFAVARYLEHHGTRLRDRFDVASYLRLIDAMDSHDVARGRGSVADALSQVGDRLTGVGIPGDLLYSAADVRGWTWAAGASYREIHSEYGHDAFLKEPEQVAAILADVLSTAPASLQPNR